ncbi:MAG: 2Fe-2S iron-sulfur cluster-binding protein [Phenylobacterium sp.]
MARILYIEANGVEHAVDVPAGWSVMEGAVKNAIPGIDADCGGACACATCHVFVVEGPEALASRRGAMEASMLEFAEQVRPNSRLACQITVTDALSGLVVRLPENQH